MAQVAIPTLFRAAHHLLPTVIFLSRGLIPGLAYQLGIVLAARTPVIEYQLKSRFSYEWALAGFEIATILGLAVIVLLGPERRGRSFTSKPSA